VARILNVRKAIGESFATPVLSVAKMASLMGNKVHMFVQNVVLCLSLFLKLSDILSPLRYTFSSY